MRLRGMAVADVEPVFDKGTEHTRKQCTGGRRAPSSLGARRSPGIVVTVVPTRNRFALTVHPSEASLPRRRDRANEDLISSCRHSAT